MFFFSSVFCFVACILKSETKSGQLCLKSSVQSHMESTSEQEPAEKQHQTTCASVSENGAVPRLFTSAWANSPSSKSVQHLSHTVRSYHARNPGLNQTAPLRSGMLEQGVDRIVAQVVDPKINHMFRPQVERVVREFLSPGSCSEEPPAPLPSAESKPDSSTLEPGTELFIPSSITMTVSLW